MNSIGGMGLSNFHICGYMYVCACNLPYTCIRAHVYVYVYVCPYGYTH